MQVLSIAMVKFFSAEEANTLSNPQDLPALASLHNLRSLVINNWCIKQAPGYLNAQPTQPHKAAFMSSARDSGTCPAQCPMKNLRDFHFERAPNKFEKFIDGDQIDSWALGKAGAINFPNVSKLYLKIMGPISVTVPNIRRGQHTKTSLIQSMIAHSSSLSSIVVEQVHMNIHATSLHFADEGRRSLVTIRSKMRLCL